MPHEPISYAKLKTMINNQMAKKFEQDGLSPLVGRIFSLLLFSEEPMGLQEMADRLGVTKAAVSVQVRALEQEGLCEKLARGSDRKDYYYIADDFGMTIVQSTTRKIRQSLDGIEMTLRHFPPADHVEPEERGSYRLSERRFREMQELYRLIADRLDGVEEEWRSRGRQWSAGSTADPV